VNKDKIAWLTGIIIVPIIIYCYFLKWKTGTIYGDDLIIYTDYLRTNTWADKYHFFLSANKFRPVQNMLFFLTVTIFQKNLFAYYIFNVLVQALNTLLLARVVNLFLKSILLSVFVSLLLGLSRFELYNVTQIFNGGALEGIAMTFFLCSLYHIVVALITPEQRDNQTKNSVLAAILFANLAIYAHERYIALFPFIGALALVAPSLKALTKKQRLALCGLSILSVIANIAVKKYLLDMPFLVGTGGTNLDFSLLRSFYFFRDGVFSIVQINSQPDYLTGTPFEFLIASRKAVATIAALCSLIVLMTCVVNAVRDRRKTELQLIVFLVILFGLLLGCSIFTIRLEQRWLQAPFAVFVLLLAMAFSSFKLRWPGTVVSITFICFFLWSDARYLSVGAEHIYLVSAEKTAGKFRHAMQNNTIKQTTSNLYVFEKTRNQNTEDEISWITGGGDIFEYYESKIKSIRYIDSANQRLQSPTDTTLRKFNPRTDQLICIKDSIIDITNEFLKDSLRNFND